MNLPDKSLQTLIRRILPSLLAASLWILVASAPTFGEDNALTGALTGADNDGQQLVKQAVKLVAQSIKNYLTKDGGVSEVFIDEFTGDGKLGLDMKSLKQSLASELAAVGISTDNDGTRFSVVGSVMAAESVGKLRFRATIIEGIRSNKTIEAQITDAVSLGMLMSGSRSASGSSGAGQKTDVLATPTKFTSTKAKDVTAEKPIATGETKPNVPDNSAGTTSTQTESTTPATTVSNPPKVQNATQCHQITPRHQIKSRWPY